MYLSSGTEKLKKMGFMLNSEKIKEALGIQATFHLEIKLQKVHF